MSPKRRRACDIKGFRAGCYPRAAQTESSNWQYQLIFLICYNTGKKGKSATWDIGTNKENMATVKWPRFSGFYWLRGRSGEKVFCFCESWRSPRISLCVGGVGHSGAERV